MRPLKSSHLIEVVLPAVLALMRQQRLTRVGSFEDTHLAAIRTEHVTSRAKDIQLAFYSRFCVFLKYQVLQSAPPTSSTEYRYPTSICLIRFVSNTHEACQSELSQVKLSRKADCTCRSLLVADLLQDVTYIT